MSPKRSTKRGQTPTGAQRQRGRHADRQPKKGARRRCKIIHTPCVPQVQVDTDDGDEKAPSKQRDATPGRSTRPPVRRREGGRAGLLARSALRQDGEGCVNMAKHTHAMPIRAHKTQLHHRQRPKVVANRQVFALGIPHTYDCRTFGGIHQNDVRRPDS